MKLRIRANSIRLRLLRGEVAALGQLERVQETTRLGPAKTDVLIYAISTHVGQDDVRIQWQSGSLELSIRQSLARALWTTEQISITADIDFSDEVLNILIEKDFKCLSLREGEDEGDSYENPQEKHQCDPK